MKPRLIIIDDHPIVARGAADLLSPLFGAECTCAHSGQEALSLVKSALRAHPSPDFVNASPKLRFAVR